MLTGSKLCFTINRLSYHTTGWLLPDNYTSFCVFSVALSSRILVRWDVMWCHITGYVAPDSLYKCAKCPPVFQRNPDPMTTKATPSFITEWTTWPVTRCHTSDDHATTLLLLNHMFGPGEIWQQQKQFSSVLVNFETDEQAKLPISFQQAELCVYEGQYFWNRNHHN